MKRRLGEWLVFLADPEGPKGVPPLLAIGLEDLGDLYFWAEAHGVLASVLQNIGPYVPAHGETVSRDAEGNSHAANGLALMLRQRARQLSPGLADLRAVIVKGASFASLLYPSPKLRRFTDLDILVHEDDVQGLSRLLEGAGFESIANPKQKAECVDWVDPEQPNVSIDVQTDLVHSAAIRRAFRLNYDDLTGDGAADPHRPAALLLTAAVHGAMHQYERLIQVVDVLQGGRWLSPDDQQDFIDLVARTRTHFVARSGLEIAGALFSDESCRALAQRLSTRLRGSVARVLINHKTVASAVKKPPLAVFWRRRLYREMLKIL